MILGTRKRKGEKKTCWQGYGQDCGVDCAREVEDAQ
jgi:hypothetical protein